VLLGGLAALGYAAAVADPPSYLSDLGDAGAVAVAVACTAGLVARTGGRTFVYAGLAVLLGAGVVVLDDPLLRTGAAVLTCVVAAVFAVMVTVPAVTALQAVREAAVATLVGSAGAVAVVGLEPTLSTARFEYTTLGASLLLCFLVVWRLGAGLHGLGRRGVLTVVIGSVVLAVTLAYAEVLRRYGAPDLVDTLLAGRDWALDTLHGAPRPVMALLGVPALVWGTHMRARRRQGWWVCAFGVTAAASVADTLLDPALTLGEVGLSTLYSLVVGAVLGLLLIRIDLLLTRGSRPRGRRSRTDEEPTTIRPEPRRTRPLL
jgi:hypothetical protein